MVGPGAGVLTTVGWGVSVGVLVMVGVSVGTWVSVGTGVLLGVRMGVMAGEERVAPGVPGPTEGVPTLLGCGFTGTRGVGVMGPQAAREKNASNINPA
jgi:hypothetical protein